MTDAAAAPSDASQSSVASDQLRTKKGARLRQATKPASAASPPARVTREGDTMCSSESREKTRSSERYYQVNRLACAALSVESVNPQRIVFGPFFV